MQTKAEESHLYTKEIRQRVMPACLTCIYFGGVLTEGEPDKWLTQNITGFLCKNPVKIPSTLESPVKIPGIPLACIHKCKNARFIDTPGLIAMVEELEKKNDELMEIIARYQENCFKTDAEKPITEKRLEDVQFSDIL